MVEKNNATCSICGKNYYKCLSCRDSMQLAPYKVHCCSADCYKVFQVIRGFSTRVYSEEEFKSKLKNIDLSNLENYKEHIKALIKDALKEEKPVAKTVKKIEPIIEVVESIESEIAEVKEETVVENVENIVKPTVSRKRNYKANNEVEATE